MARQLSLCQLEVMALLPQMKHLCTTEARDNLPISSISVKRRLCGLSKAYKQVLKDASAIDQLPAAGEATWKKRARTTPKASSSTTGIDTTVQPKLANVRPGNPQPSIRQLNCDECNFSTLHRSRLILHKAAHANKREFRCTFQGCSKYGLLKKRIII